MTIGIVNTFYVSRTRVSIGLLGTYVPQRCGIATFSKDVADSVLKENPLNKVEVAAIVDPSVAEQYPKEVKVQIERDDQQSYFTAAQYFNRSDAMLVNIQHEFGIFGGKDGENVLTFIHALKKPVVTTLHTILEQPANEHMRNILVQICERSTAVIVMLPYAMKILTQVYGVPAKKIYVIPHGVPESNFFDSVRIKKVLDLQDRTVLSTFGLISSGKGLGYMIEALPNIIKENPKVLYLIIGVTHPNVIKHEGEAYREQLVARIEQLGIADHVMFVNKFLDIDELVRYLLATDVYVVPYLNKDQITSGTLAYAIGCGKAIVSTPFIYAEEMLKDDRGVLVNFRDTDGLAIAVNRILGDHHLKTMLEENAYTFGRQMIWSSVGNALTRLFRRINRWQRLKNLFNILQHRTAQDILAALKKGKHGSDTIVRQTLGPTMLFLQGYPPLNFSHINRMTDDVGIFQHALYAVPNRVEGYTLDDNARALIMMVMKNKLSIKPDISSAIYTYLSFIHYAYAGKGVFRNFLGFDRRWREERGSDDSIGRALWALGYTYCNYPKEPIGQLARQMVLDCVAYFPALEPLRSQAFALLGLCLAYAQEQSRSDIKERIILLADVLVRSFDQHSQKKWRWFEPYLTYANGRLPHALLMAYAVTGEKKYLQTALQSLDFLREILIIDNTLVIIGNEDWYMRDGRRSFYDQQPIDASCMVEVFMCAYEVTRDKKYYRSAKIAFNWFFGANSLKQPLVDPHTGGCYDGLLADSVNKNQGAESTITYMTAYLTMLHLKENIELPLITAFRKYRRARTSGVKAQ